MAASDSRLNRESADAIQTNRNAAWYSMLGVVTIFGSLLSYGLGHIQSDVLYSYQVL